MKPERTIYQTLTFYLLALATFLVDQFSKFAIVTALALGHSRPLLDGVFNLTYVRNLGAAFSLFHGQVIMLGVVAGGIALGVVYYQHTVRPNHLTMVLGLGFLLGGALGNFIDRLAFGYVRDMFDLRWNGHNIWPIFNVADMAVIAGVGCLFLYSYLGAQDEPERYQTA